MADDKTSRTGQMVGSLLVALLIVVVAIIVVTAKFGPTSAAELEEREERLEERLEQREERREQQEERRESSNRSDKAFADMGVAEPEG